MALKRINKSMIDQDFVKEVTDHGQKLNDVTEQLAQTSYEINEISYGERFDIRTKGRKRRTMVSFTDDDGRIETYTRLKPVVDSKKIPYTLAIPTGDIDKPQYITHSQLIEMYNKGFEIMSHGNSQNIKWDTSTLSEIETDIKTALNKFAEWGINDIFIHSYVEGRSRKDARMDIGSKYFRACVGTDQKINTVPYESYLLGRVGMFPRAEDISEITGHPINTMAHYKAMVDKAVTEQGWLIFMTHAWYETFNPSELAELIDYIRSLNIDIVSLHEGINTTGNILEIGEYDKRLEHYTGNYFVVDCEGNIKTTNNRGRSIVYPPSSFTSSDAPTKFTLEEIGHTRIFGDTGFPEKNGILITSTVGVWGGANYRNWYYCYQEYVCQNGKKFIRKASDDGTSWKTWIEETNSSINFLQDYTLPFSKPLSEYPSGVTYSAVNYDNATGFPNNKAGTLVTYKIGNSSGYAYQEYIIYSDGTKYIRGCDNTTGNWKAFKMVTTV